MKILMMSWRDRANPAAGGAEVVTHEISWRWVRDGHHVTWLTSGFPNGRAREEVEGVQIIRLGKQHTVHYEAFRYYKRHMENQFDLIIDQVNTIPFFTPLYVREKRLAFFHQLARKVWFYESRFPMSVFGYLIEPWYLRLYRNTPVITISDSTKEDLQGLGIREVYVVPDGMSMVPLSDIPSLDRKEERPTILYVGRLVPSKRIADVIEAMRYVHASVPNAQLWIVGDGSRNYIASLQDKVSRYQLTGNVRFWGKVSEEVKTDLMKRGHVLALASVHEGWGLAVVEANAMGMPAVVYNVQGLRDSVRHGETGIICAKNQPVELAQNLVSLLKNQDLLTRFAHGALRWSRNFTWERMASEFLTTAGSILDHHTPLVCNQRPDYIN